MAELWFYQIEHSELEALLPPLIEKCLQRGWRALLRAGSEERVAALDILLWTYRDDSFLPHACSGDPARQPVWLTVAGGNPNGAQALFLLDSAEPGDLSGFERACLIFDGRDPTATESARSRWKQAAEMGLASAFWRERTPGKWEKQE